MKLLKFLFYLSSITFAFLAVKIYLYSLRDRSVPKLRQSDIDHTVIPCGERELHDEMVQYISEIEPRYLHCLQLERDNRDFISAECHFDDAHTDLLRRIHKLRNEQEHSLRIVQIGASDGMINDPLYQAVFLPHLSAVETRYKPSFSLERIHSVIVMPSHVNDVSKKFVEWSHQISSMDMANFKFVETAINDANLIDNKSHCVFYALSSTCPLKLKKNLHFDSLDSSHMQGLFGKNSELCINRTSIPCLSMSGLLRSIGEVLIIPPTAGASVQVWCRDNSHQKPEPMSDILLLNGRGNENIIIYMTLRDLCSTLWPTIIIYEDKFLRNSRSVSNIPGEILEPVESGEHVLDTETADNVIDFLEQNGYYVLLVGENVVALRVGYSIDDMRHSLFDPPDLSIFRQKAWLHPRSSRSMTA